MRARPSSPRESWTPSKHYGRSPKWDGLGRLTGTRELVVSGTPFIVPYRVKHERLELLAVFDGRRQWPRRL
jgi:toxin ParE1/3/4